MTAVLVDAGRAEPADLLAANGCVVAEAFATVAARTGFGATVYELADELEAQGYGLDAETITYALRDADGTLLVESARGDEGVRLTRGGGQVFLPIEAL